MGRTAVAYCRASEPAESIADRQMPTLREYAVARGIELLCEFWDDGDSAASGYLERPGWKLLLATAQQLRVDSVLVSDEVQLDNDPTVRSRILEQIAMLGMDLLCASNGSVPDDCQAARSARVCKANEDCLPLIRRLQAGDESVLRDIVERFGNELARYVERAIGHDDQARGSVLTDALLRLWQRRDSYDQKRKSLRQWLYYLTGQEISKVLEERRRPHPLVSSEALLGIPAEISETSETRTLSEIEKDLFRLLGELPEAEFKIIYRYAETGGGGCWAKELEAELQELGYPTRFTANYIRGRAPRLVKKIRKCLIALGHDVPCM